MNFQKTISSEEKLKQMVTELDIHGDPRQRKGFRGKEREEGKKLYMRELLKASQKLTAPLS